LHTKNQVYTLPGSALKVCVVGGGGGLVISFGFGQAEQLNKNNFWNRIC
jgi:hypothetical protein